MDTFTFIKSQAVLFIFYLLYVKVLHKRVSFGYSRLFLLSIIPLSFVLSLLNIQVSSEYYRTFGGYLSGLSIVPEQAESPDEPAGLFGGRLSWTNILLIVYAGGCLVAFLFFCIRCYLFSGLIHKGKQGFVGDTEVIILPGSGSAFSLFGKVMIGEQIFSGRNTACIVRHEKFHCALFHSADTVLIAFQKMFLWFNPVVWHLDRLLREVHEYQVDEYMIRSGTDLLSYSDILIHFEMGHEPHLSNPFGYSSLKGRINMLAAGKAKSNKRFLVFLPVICVFILLFCITPSNIAISKEENTVSEESIPVYPFASCPVKPLFQGGDQNEFTKWVFEHINYPEAAKKARVQGRVTLQFTVTEEGMVTDVKVARGVDDALDREAMRVVSLSPGWTPGKDADGRPVKVRYTFPIIFHLK